MVDSFERIKKIFSLYVHLNSNDKHTHIHTHFLTQTNKSVYRQIVYTDIP